MDIAITPGRTTAFLDKVKNLTDLCRISNIEKMLSEALDYMPSDSALNYIGELNKNDIMH